MAKSTNNKKVTSFFGNNSESHKTLHVSKLSSDIESLTALVEEKTKIIEDLTHKNQSIERENSLKLGLIKRLQIEIRDLKNKFEQDLKLVSEESKKVEEERIAELTAVLRAKIDQLEISNQKLKELNLNHVKIIKRLTTEIEKLVHVEAPTPVVVETIKPEVKESPKPVVVETIKPVVKEAPKPVVVKSSNGPLKISRRDPSIKPKLAVITTFFNPMNYINIRSNYIKFSKQIKECADLFPIELSFNNEFFIDDERSIRINGDSSNILWQKERLLQIALDNLPPEYTNVAWIDCDVIFENKNWVEDINKGLESYKVVQVFENAKRLDGNGNSGNRISGIIKKIDQGGQVYRDIYGTPGFGWAIRREVIDKIKFIDTQIIGGADAIMFFSFFGITETRILKDHINREWLSAISGWMEDTHQEIDGSVGYIKGDIVHLYHGMPANRGYSNRHDILRKFKFDPRIHLELEENGLWKFKSKTLNDSLKKYFSSRNEDDNVIRLNEYVDKVWVINLERSPERLQRTRTELEKFKIEFERFPAVDGNNIQPHEYDFSGFKQGMGMFENKWALACFRSHIEIIKDAKRKNYKRIVIFEDDIIIDPQFDVMLQNIKEIDEWKLLYFGASQYNWDVEIQPNFYISKNTLGGFAYAIDSSIYDAILEEAEREDVVIDKLLSNIQEANYGKCYTFYPNIIIPDVTESNIRQSRNQIEHSKRMRWNLLN